MASIILNAAERGSIQRVAEGAQLQARGTRDGAMFTASWYEAHALEGRVFVANMGTVTTPLTFLAAAANRPDAWVRVPSGTMIVPLGLTVALEAFAGTVTEIDVRTAQNDIGNGSSSAAASVGPQSNHTGVPYSSNCTARQLAAADTTAETNPLTLWRKTIPTASAAGNDAAGSFDVTREMMGYPILVGPATWEVYIAATTTQATGFVVMKWIEFVER